MRRLFAASVLGPLALSSGCRAGPEVRAEPPRAVARPAPLPAPPVAPAEPAVQVETASRSWPEAEAWPQGEQVVVRGRGDPAQRRPAAVTFEPGPLGEVLATISRQADLNLVAAPGVDLEARVAWGLRDVAWRDAVRFLCARLDLEERPVGERTLCLSRVIRVTIQ